MGFENAARGLARVGLLPLPRRTSLATLVQNGKAGEHDGGKEAGELVSVAPPQIAIDRQPARFHAAVGELVSGYQTVDSSTWTVHEARFAFPSGLVAVDGAAIQETLVQRIWPHSYQYIPLARIARGQARRVAPGCVFAYPHWNNMYHWLAVMLPVALKLRDETDLPLYVGRDGPRFTAESLAFLGLDDRCVALDDGVFSCESLVVATVPGHGLDRPSPRHVHRVRRALLERLSSDPSKRRRIYISRDDARDRRVLNESELVEALAELGFEKVVLGDLSFADQLRVFGEAEIVIGAHGAGLANAVVGREGSWLIELVGDKVVNPMYAALASFVGVNYGYVRVADSYRDHIAEVHDVIDAVQKALPDVNSTPAARARA